MTEEKSKLEKLIFQEHFKITFRVIGITLGTMAIFAGSGYILDKQLGTWPLLFIVGLVLAFPITQIINYKVFKNFTDKYKK